MTQESWLSECSIQQNNNVHKSQKHFFKLHFLSYLPFILCSYSHSQPECFLLLSSLILSYLWENREERGTMRIHSWSAEPGPGAMQEDFPEEVASWLSTEELVEVRQKKIEKGILDRRNSPKGKNKRAGLNQLSGARGWKSVWLAAWWALNDLYPGLGLALLEMPMAELIWVHKLGAGAEV